MLFDEDDWESAHQTASPVRSVKKNPKGLGKAQKEHNHEALRVHSFSTFLADLGAASFRSCTRI